MIKGGCVFGSIFVFVYLSIVYISRVDSGFRHVEINKQEYQPRLLHFHGDKVITPILHYTFKYHSLIPSLVIIYGMYVSILLLDISFVSCLCKLVTYLAHCTFGLCPGF